MWLSRKSFAERSNVDCVVIPSFPQDFLICRQALRHLALHQGTVRRVWEILLQSLCNVTKSFTSSITVICCAGFENRFVASSSPSCSKYKLHFTRPLSSESLRIFDDCLYIFVQYYFKFCSYNRSLFIFLYPEISN